MTTNLLLGLLVGFVLLSGIFVTGLSSFDAFAEKGDNNGDKGCKNSEGKGNGNAQACTKNPNRNGGGNGGTLPENTCDGNNSGTLTADELDGVGQGLIDAIENLAGDSDNDKTISTIGEWNLLQIEKPGLCAITAG